MRILRVLVLLKQLTIKKKTHKVVILEDIYRLKKKKRIDVFTFVCYFSHTRKFRIIKTPKLVKLARKKRSLTDPTFTFLSVLFRSNARKKIENHCPVGELVKAYPARDLVHTM